MLKQVQKRQAGFSLVEMLVATLVLSLGLLGIAGMQTLSLRNNNNSYMSTQANLMAYDIVDSMRANRDAALASSYNIAMSSSAPAGNAVWETDLRTWLGNVGSLPNGDGSVDCDAANDVCTIKVRWAAYGDTVNLTSISVSTEI